MIDFFSKARWFTNRDRHMIAARECRATLTDPQSYWRYAPDDERVKEAVAAWVARARAAHDIAMGCRPVIPNVVVISLGVCVRGSISVH